MITVELFNRLVEHMGAVAQDDIDWSEGTRPPKDAEGFASEVIFAICNSGMKNTVARAIFTKVVKAILDGEHPFTVFKHQGKTDAIQFVWDNRERLMQEYLAADDKLAYCATLPWIGNITKYHVAKNFGIDVSKPDVHLQRLADREGVTPQKLCEDIARVVGYKAATVDVVLWRACALGIINSKTGEVWLKS